MATNATNTFIEFNNGQKIPAFGLGTWRSDPGLVEQAVYDAIKLGYRHIDAAYVYENQDEVGRGIKKAITEGIVQRADLFITTKLWNTSHHPDDVEPEAKKSLDQLQLDYIDLYLIHWPVAFSRGDNLFPKEEKGFKFIDIPITDTYKALEKLVTKGLVKSIGVSNFSIEQVDQILAVATIKPVTNQVEAHPYWNQSALQAHHASHGIVITAYSPLGNLNPKDEKAASPLKDEKVVLLSKKYNKSPAQILIRWSLQTGKVVIPKSVTFTRIQENADVFDFQLSAEDVNTLSSLPQSRLLNPPFGKDGANFW